MVCLGFEPRGGRMEGANESTELRRHFYLIFMVQVFTSRTVN